MTEPPKTHPCPICGAAVAHWPRYPRALCEACADLACDDRGRKLRFSNVSFSGGFLAVVAETGEEHADHRCFVSGVACWADEARFGGIVVQPAGGASGNDTAI